ncbi:MAG: protein kinase, partial [Pirellulales bacterium]
MRAGELRLKARAQMEKRKTNVQPESSLSAANAIDQLCDRFEAAWSTGDRPRIEAYLAELIETARPRAFEELLSVELEMRRRVNETPTAGEYQTRFPEFRPTIERLFSDSSTGRKASSSRSACVLDASNTPTTDFGDTSESRTGATRVRSLPEANPLEERIGRFRILKTLGTGGFGAVYRAHDEQLDREVAIKVPRPGTLGSESSIARFLDESRLAARLKHPGIVTIYDAGRTPDGTVYVSVRPTHCVAGLPERVRGVSGVGRVLLWHGFLARAADSRGLG